MLTKRNPAPPRPLPDGWVVSTTLELPGRPLLEPGVELTIRLDGRNGRRCRFLRHVSTLTGEWVDVFDGKALRSFKLDNIATVHRSRRMPGCDS